MKMVLRKLIVTIRIFLVSFLGGLVFGGLGGCTLPTSGNTGPAIVKPADGSSFAFNSKIRLEAGIVSSRNLVWRLDSGALLGRGRSIEIFMPSDSYIVELFEGSVLLGKASFTVLAPEYKSGQFIRYMHP